MKALKTILFLTILISSSCGPIYFLHPTRVRIQNENRKNIEKVQFYIDRHITLVHKSVEKNEDITGGKIEFRDGYYFYYIQFPKKTPCLAEELDAERLKIYFEKGNNRYLVFVRMPDSEYQLAGNRKGRGLYVNFEGKEFKVESGADARLQINKSDEADSKYDSRTVKGLKVDE